VPVICAGDLCLVIPLIIPGQAPNR
jgi:hypothetical protein